MTILADWQIKDLCGHGLRENQKMISPFVSDQMEKNEHGNKIIPYGLCSHGYDGRLGNKFKVFTGRNGGVVDPKFFYKTEDQFLEYEEGETCIVPPNSYVLGVSVEYFRIPRNIKVHVLGKSTYARCGLIVNLTPGEAGWEGHFTLELCNGTPCPIKVYADEGICQYEFIEVETPLVSYADRQGKYNKQPDHPVGARIK